MKILHVSHRHFIAGGSDAVFFQTTDLLARAGHQVVPFCIRDQRNHPSEWSDYFPGGADTGAMPLFDGLRYFWNAEARRNLKRLIAEHGPFDLAHLHIYHGKHTPSILPVLRDAGIPVVQSLHEYKIACPVYTLQRGEKPCEACVSGTSLNALRYRCKNGSLLRSGVMWAEFLTARALGDVAHIDRFLCVSEFQRAIMERAGIAADKLAVLHNCAVPASRPGRGNGGLLYFGRIEEIKGLPVLVEAAIRTGLKLTIAGQGGWSGEMQRRIAGHGNIRYLGFRSGPALARLVRHATAVVVPSEWYENCPMSVLEAKAAGVPVIGAAIGGIPELVRDGVDGFLFRPGDAGALIGAFEALQGWDRAALARNALGDARSRFAPAVHLRGLLDCYGALGAADRQGSRPRLSAPPITTSSSTASPSHRATHRRPTLNRV